jgi:hypothetical protein
MRIEESAEYSKATHMTREMKESKEYIDTKFAY